MLEKEEVLVSPFGWPRHVPPKWVVFCGSVPIARNKSHLLTESLAALLRMVKEFPRHPAHFLVIP